ncbi:hypothetical protein ACHAXR_003355 [Thalassiosira sp. AJA248-18]
MKRRDRYNARMMEEYDTTTTTSSTNIAATTADDNNATADETTSSSSDTTTTSSPYITLANLNQLLSTQNLILPSEAPLQQRLSVLVMQLMNQHIASDDAMLKARLEEVTKRYEKEYDALQQEMGKNVPLVDNGGGQCLAIPQAVELVGKALEEHYYDGTNLIDHASYENGGSVVYELTSASYVPPPRMDASVGIDGSSKRAMYEYQKQKMFDEQTESMYHHHQRTMMTNDDATNNSIMNQLSEVAENMNGWEWYTSFKFENLRQYLPDDWERLLDNLFDNRLDESSPSWSDYTPRGAMDVMIPDYVYHSLGISNDANFGKVFGRTASPEVAISTGYSKSGGGDGSSSGWTAKPLGQCYPLSMRQEDDPALSLLSRRTHMEGGMEVMDEDVGSSMLVGPKYTVRLPYPVYIDAVTLEHRSFPLSQGSLEGGTKGGESAPRWEEDGVEEEEEDDGCGVRGFDISKPIDLGSFEYQRITVTGREDDYGGGDDDGIEDSSPFSGRRRRSIQTFAVKGGKQKPSLLFGNDSPEEEGEDDASDATLCSADSESCGAPPTDKASLISEPEPEPDPLPVGQCAPPKDEDSAPSCGADASSSASSSESNSVRQVVEAVSLIVEENWGNSEFTCLYRVRVHGDAVSD